MKKMALLATALAMFSGSAMAADPFVLLVDSDVMSAVQDVGGAEPRNARADDSDLCHVPFS